MALPPATMMSIYLRRIAVVSQAQRPLCSRSRNDRPAAVLYDNRMQQLLLCNSTDQGSKDWQLLSIETQTEQFIIPDVSHFLRIFPSRISRFACSRADGVDMQSRC